MADAFWFWIAKSLAEFAIGIFIIAAFGALIGLIALPGAIQRMRCKHPRVWESRELRAICRDCTKDLGFVGAWRDKTKDRLGTD